MNFSKWNKRITIWLLLIVGFYMGIFEYPIEYLMIFLGSGLAAMGLAVWGNINVIKDNPPPNLEEHDKKKSYKENERVIHDGKEWRAIVDNGPCEFNESHWVCLF